MPVKYTDDFIRNCIELNKSGNTLIDIAKRFGIKAQHLSLRMRKLGHAVIDYRKRQLPKNELIKLYTSGWSVKKLAEKYKVDRKTIASRLIQEGIKPRNRSESMFNRMAFTSEEERKRLVQRANEAVRNRPAKRERLQKGSITRSIHPTKKLIGFGENSLKAQLEKLESN